MKYCADCGSVTERAIPKGDTRMRDVCTNCNAIWYSCPKIVSASIPVYEDRILLCKRAIGPRAGCWTLPGGYMEAGETMMAAAVRETREEACAEISNPTLFLIADIPDVFQVHAFYHAKLVSPDFKPGEETIETALFAFNDIPWWELAFRSTFYALYYFVQDVKSNQFDCREVTISSIPKIT